MADGGKIKRWRLKRAMTIRQLSERSGVNHSAISLIERGLREPRPSTLQKLAEALEVAIGDLLRDDF